MYVFFEHFGPFPLVWAKKTHPRSLRVVTPPDKVLPSDKGPPSDNGPPRTGRGLPPHKEKYRQNIKEEHNFMFINVKCQFSCNVNQWNLSAFDRNKALKEEAK